MNSASEGSKQVLGVIFDMDGTLIHEAIDYAAMRAALGMPVPIDVILEIRRTEDVSKQQEYWAIIEEFEHKARIDLKAHEGSFELLEFLRENGVRLGLFTRNSTHGITAMKATTGFTFDYELSRDFHPPKPAPDGAIEIAKAWGIPSENIIFVGDSGDDLKCGIAAGMKTVLFDPESRRPHLHSLASLVVKSMAELQTHLMSGVLL
jgi:HAD superfamily hydrolase (TIGR01549 family)